MILLGQTDQTAAGDPRVGQGFLLLRCDPVEQGRRHQRLFPQRRPAPGELGDHIPQGLAGRDLIVYEQDRVCFLQQGVEVSAPELLLGGVAVLLQKADPARPFPGFAGGGEKGAVRAEPTGHRGPQGRGRLGKAEDQPRPRKFLPQPLPQGPHHGQGLRRGDGHVLGLQGVDQQIGPLGVPIAFGDPKGRFFRVTCRVAWHKTSCPQNMT